eukprot:scaffold36278_cov134-Isochrysis_galbana.AAC.4
MSPRDWRISSSSRARFAAWTSSSPHRTFLTTHMLRSPWAKASRRVLSRGAHALWTSDVAVCLMRASCT